MPCAIHLYVFTYLQKKRDESNASDLAVFMFVRFGTKAADLLEIYSTLLKLRLGTQLCLTGTYIYKNIHMYEYTHMCIYTYTYINIYIYICMYI